MCDRVRVRVGVRIVGWRVANELMNYELLVSGLLSKVVKMLLHVRVP